MMLAFYVRNDLDVVMRAGIIETEKDILKGIC